jgi:Fuc2NAc and GlcNAc transferase
MRLALILVTAFLAGLLGAGWVRHYALRRRLLDVPNDRSSHTRPTPRGGGLAIALTVLFVIAWTGISGELEWSVVSAILPSLFLVGLIGWLDDHFEIDILWRACTYLVAAGWFVWLMGGIPVMMLGAFTWKTGIWNIPLLVLGLAWLTNLYNFMDGADALAGLQAVLAGIAGAVLFWLQGAESLSFLAAVTAAAAAGFLVWNWPPARIFMGDVGSCFLGFLFGCLAVLGETMAGLPALLWLILLGVFVWDATCTLFLRMLRGETWYAAHRSHAYQRLLQLGWSHGRVALAFLLYNLLILWPLTIWAYYYPDYLLVSVISGMVITVFTWGMVQLQYSRLKGAVA